MSANILFDFKQQIINLIKGGFHWLEQWSSHISKTQTSSDDIDRSWPNLQNIVWGYYLISSKSIRGVRCGGWNAFLHGVYMVSSCLQGFSLRQAYFWLISGVKKNVNGCLPCTPLAFQWADNLSWGVSHPSPKGSWTRLQPPVTPLRDEEGKDRWIKCR